MQKVYHLNIKIFSVKIVFDLGHDADFIVCKMVNYCGIQTQNEQQHLTYKIHHSMITICIL